MTLNGATASCTKDQGRFVVSITDIPAYQLGKMNTVVVKTGATTTTVKVSVMSYVRDILKKADIDETTRDAFIALYKYYAAAAAYKG